jgi:hypothetical protein
MMSMVGAAVAPDTAAALVLGDDPLHGGKGFDRRRWPLERSCSLPWLLRCVSQQLAHCRDGGRPSWRPVVEVLRA